MSNFIKLGPCPHCGSKDNRAEYENGYWCFGCSKLEPKEDTESLRDRIRNRSNESNSSIAALIDTVTDIPQQPMRWLLKYNITPEEIKMNGIKWNPARKLLVLIQNNSYWQARNFGFGNIKYMSQGIKPLTIYGKGDTIVVVEDVLSAIKIARLRHAGICSTPLLGSSVSKKTMSQLVKDYKTIYVWLDRDKARTAVDIKNKFRSLGIISKAIISDLDPKEYNKTEILEWLKN